MIESVPLAVWLVLTLGTGLIALFAVRARGYSRGRGLAVLGFLIAGPISAIALAFSLGWPVLMVNNVTIPEGKHTILAAKMIIGDGIYLFIDRGDLAPRYYKLPWDAKTADEVQQKMDERGEGGEAGITVPKFKWPWEGDEAGEGEGADGGQQGKPGKGGSMNPMEWSWDVSPPQFWAAPQPKVLPDKPTEEAPLVYDQEI